MSKIEVLISTMNQENVNFIEAMNISTDAVVVNQNENSDKNETLSFDGHQVKLVNSREKGLSKSRNLAIQHSSADICVLADDDMRYDDGYAEKIRKAYEENSEADIIAFQVERTGNSEREKTFRQKLSWENYITSMKISSVEITFKREKIVENNITFNPNVGAGTEFSQGEENIFIYEALKKGLKVLYVPVKIAQVDVSESSWFEGYTEKYFNTVGAKFYNMSNKFYHLLIYQFAIRKYKMYKNDMSLKNAIRHMFSGVYMYKDKFGSE